jgi:hypothetical protein
MSQDMRMSGSLLSKVELPSLVTEEAIPEFNPSPAVEEAIVEAPVKAIDKTDKVYTDIEIRALQKGWKPVEEWKGDADEHLSAKEFMHNHTWLVHNTKLKQEVAEQRKMLEYLADVAKKAEDVGKKRALEELKLAQVAAIKSGDIEEVNKITERLIRESEVSEETKDAAIGNPVLKAFKERNKAWFNRDTAENSLIADYAILKDNELIKTHPHLTEAERYKAIETDVQKRFTEKFENPAKFSSSAVSANVQTAAAVKDKEVSLDGLSAHHKDMITRLKKTVRNFDVKGYVEIVSKIDGVK